MAVAPCAAVLSRPSLILELKDRAFLSDVKLMGGQNASSLVHSDSKREAVDRLMLIVLGTPFYCPLRQQRHAELNGFDDGGVTRCDAEFHSYIGDMKIYGCF